MGGVSMRMLSRISLLGIESLLENKSSVEMIGRGLFREGSKYGGDSIYMKTPNEERGIKADETIRGNSGFLMFVNQLLEKEKMYLVNVYYKGHSAFHLDVIQGDLYIESGGVSGGVTGE